MTRKILFFVVVLFTLAPLLWASHSAFTTSDSRLWQFQLETGEYGVVGETGYLIYCLAFSPNGELYGLTDAGDIVTVDPATAEATLVGPLVEPVDPTAADLEFDHDGVLWLLEPSYPAVLYSVDTTTGRATARASFEQVFMLGLASARGRLIAGGWSFWELDPDSGSATEITAIPNLGTNGIVAHLSFGHSGFLWGRSAAPYCPGPSPCDSAIAAFDLESGAKLREVFVPSASIQFTDALAIRSASVFPIPALSGSGIIALISLFAVAGVCLIRRGRL